MITESCQSVEFQIAFGEALCGHQKWQKGLPAGSHNARATPNNIITA
jgi:hypothetical protein